MPQDEREKHLRFMTRTRPAGLDKDAVEWALAEIERLTAENESMEEALTSIAAWSKAYPIEVFPEPDFKKAAKLLKAGGITLDAISASNMRHVVEGVGKIAIAALSTRTWAAQAEPDSGPDVLGERKDVSDG